MADPTATEVLDALKVVGGRQSLLWNEVLRLLHDVLPGAIAAANAAYHIGIPEPRGYYVAPESLNDDYINSLCVAAAVRTQPEGPRQFKDVVTVTIFDITEPFEQRNQLDDIFDRSALVRAVLWHTCGGKHYNPAGKFCWWNMQPVGVSTLPSGWSAYSGVALTYTAFQGPADGQW